MKADLGIPTIAFGGLNRRRFLILGGLGGATMLAAPALAQSGLGGGVLTISQTSDAQPTNVLALRAGNVPWIKNVFETLTTINPETFDPEPLLATDWQFADDGMSMDITLRDDVTFHTGRKMTAKDVKFTLEICAKPESAVQTGFIARDFDAIEVAGEHALTIRFKRPLGNVFDLFDQAVIVDSETYEQRVDGSRVIGTGPFRFASWSPGAAIMLEKYADHRDADQVQLSQIECAVITDSTASISALRSQRSALAFGLATSDVIEFQGNPMYDIRLAGGAIYPFGVNVTMAPFDKKEVRQAMGYAVDRQRINNQVFDATGTTTDLFWSPSSPGYTDEMANRYTYDPERARQMIIDAGAEGAEVPITIPAIPANRSIFEIVQNNLREVGLHPSANVLDVTEYDKRQVAGDLGPAFILIHGQVGFGSTTLLGSLPSLREGNPSEFWTDRYVELRNRMSAATDRPELEEATKALSEYMLDEAFSLTLVQAAGPTVIADRLRGVELGVHGEVKLANASLT